LPFLAARIGNKIFAGVEITREFTYTGSASDSPNGAFLQRGPRRAAPPFSLPVRTNSKFFAFPTAGRSRKKNGADLFQQNHCPASFNAIMNIASGLTAVERRKRRPNHWYIYELRHSDSSFGGSNCNFARDLARPHGI